MVPGGSYSYWGHHFITHINVYHYAVHLKHNIERQMQPATWFRMAHELKNGLYSFKGLGKKWKEYFMTTDK